MGADALEAIGARWNVGNREMGTKACAEGDFRVGKVCTHQFFDERVTSTVARSLLPSDSILPRSDPFVLERRTQR